MLERSSLFIQLNINTLLVALIFTYRNEVVTHWASQKGMNYQFTLHCFVFWKETIEKINGKGGSNWFPFEDFHEMFNVALELKPHDRGLLSNLVLLYLIGTWIFQLLWCLLRQSTLGHWGYNLVRSIGVKYLDSKISWEMWKRLCSLSHGRTNVLHTKICFEGS